MESSMQADIENDAEIDIEAVDRQTSQPEKSDTNDQKPLILMTGATGYVGGRLIPRLLHAGYRVRTLVRGEPERLAGRSWYETVEVVIGDALKPETLPAAFAGVEVAYYLIHSMGGSDAEFAKRDLKAARSFAQAAAKAGVKRIIYLGGLGDSNSDLSEHLRSRQATGAALSEAGVPVTEFRAGMVVGSGSLSFEMLRSLCERLPVMLCPKWVYTHTQPIAIQDVIAYFIAALKEPESAGKIIEIGGATVLSYKDMMAVYARLRGFHRIFIPWPLLAPGLSSYWVHWITPIRARMARPLILGLRNEVVVRNNLAKKLFPQIHPVDFALAVHKALSRTEGGDVETIWSDALVSSSGDIPPVYFTEEQGMLIERRTLQVHAPADAVYRAFAGIGGKRGWPAFNLLWVLRGLLDRAVGGVGLRRGRRHPDNLRAGDALDWWRVESVKPNESILLRAEMKLPGKGWLQFEVQPDEKEPDATCLVQTAYFAPQGLAGLLYWYAVYPLHGMLFSTMIQRIANLAEASKSLEAGTTKSLLDEYESW
jgi:uncharacterized protein YbjT (DUF2867 family)